MHTIIFYLLLLLTNDYIYCTRENTVSSLTDEEYNILLNKIINNFDTPVAERSTTEKAVLRKYYRWIKAGKQITIGASFKNIYVDGKRLMRKSELKEIVTRMEKCTKQSGVRKITHRINSRYAGWS